jgi:hypothetical protein
MPLLCHACEIKFQQGGEDWVLAMRYRSDGSFPLRSLLQAATPISSNKETSIFDARSINGLDVGQLLYISLRAFFGEQDLQIGRRNLPTRQRLI